MHTRLKKIIVILSTLCVLFVTSVVPSLATSTDTTSHRPTYPLAPYEGNMSLNVSNDYGVNREDVYTLTFDSNSSMPLPSLGDSIATSANNVLSTKQTLPAETEYKTLYQYIRYVPNETLGVNAMMINKLTADDNLKRFLSQNQSTSTSLSFHFDELYIPYKNNRPNLYYLPSVTLDLAGVTARGFSATRYVYYSFTTYSFDASGKMTTKAQTYTVLVSAGEDGTLTFPLIPYARSLPSTEGAPYLGIPSSDFTRYTQGFTALRPTYDSAIPLASLSTPLGGSIRLGNLNVTVLIPQAQKPYIADGDVSINYASVYYKPPNGSATNSKQNVLATAYMQSLGETFSVPSDTSWFGWIVDSVAGFLDIRIIGNLTLGTVFGLVFSVPLLVLVLRSFDGG